MKKILPILYYCSSTPKLHKNFMCGPFVKSQFLSQKVVYLCLRNIYPYGGVNSELKLCYNQPTNNLGIYKIDKGFDHEIDGFLQRIWRKNALFKLTNTPKITHK